MEWIQIIIQGGAVGLCVALIILLWKTNQTHEKRSDKYLEIISKYADKMEGVKDAVDGLTDQIEKLAQNNGQIADVLSTNGHIINKYFEKET